MWFIFDGLGLALGFFTYVLIAFADWVIVHHVLLVWFRSTQPRIDWLPLTNVGWVVCLLYQSVLFLSVSSHFAAMTTDPGTIKEKGPPAGFVNPRYCKLCKDRWKPPRAHHCKTCHRCIFRMDHHCPWINNCIGLSNQKLFILFLGYTSLSAITTLVMLLASAGYWLWSQKSWSEAAPPGGSALICCGIVAVECLAAVIFVGDFLQEQIESIQTNSTLVETYQRTHGPRTTSMDHFKAVFGHQMLAWPWPYPSYAPVEYCEPAVPESDGAVDKGENIGIAGEESEVRGADLLRNLTGASQRPAARPFDAD